YLEWGHAGLPAVVCLHGGGQTAYMYEQLGASLAGRFHVLAWDSADHGDSDPFLDPAALVGPVDRYALAADAGPLCAEFGISRAVFVGASMGGLVSVTVAATRPDLVGAVVLLDVGHRLEPAGVERITAFLAQHESFADLEEAAAAIADYLPGRAVTQGRLTRNLRQRADGRWVWKHGLGRRIRATGVPVDAGERAKAVVEGLDDDLRQLHRPTLVLRGAQSDVLSEAGADELVALLPDARYARITGAGHLAAGDNPESFVGLVGRFLDEIGWADPRLNPS
ncbi:MAG: alpha/beta hydrolase, partial [Actinobacteria bacterium]|nr:alpha/beta hydrolase [Actinomycetota bacterium]